jgi:hypothetical protein
MKNLAQVQPRAHADAVLLGGIDETVLGGLLKASKNTGMYARLMTGDAPLTRSSSLSRYTSEIVLRPSSAAF